MIYKWKLQPKAPPEFTGAVSPQQPLLSDILWHRGVIESDEAQKYLHPDYNAHLHDPFLMKNMRDAVLRIKKAILANEKILIFGDFDADGIGAVVVIHDFFLKIGFKNFEVYMPGRMREGRDLTPDQIADFKDRGISLLVTFDTGIDAHDAVEEANKSQIDVVIVDHHIPPQTLPQAYAVVDPKQEGETYPTAFLCGSGLAFKVVQGLIREKDTSWNIPDGWEKWLLDVVAIATVADMVPLKDENRVLVYWGLQVLRKNRRVGLKELLKIAKINPKYIDAETVAFEVGPRINAASRMDHANSSFLLLTTSSSDEARRLAELINGKNVERKELVGEIETYIKDNVVGTQEDQPFIWAGSKEWSPAVLGVVANRIIEKTGKPVFMWGMLNDTVVKGSARSPDVDIRAVLEKCSSCFLNFGGHKLASGFTMELEKVETAYQCVAEAMQTASVGIDGEELAIDGELNIHEATFDFYKTIASLEPFGQEFSKPLFVFRGVKLDNVREMGKNGGHWRIGCTDNKGRNIGGILFFASSQQSACIKEGGSLDIAAHVEFSRFNGSSELRLRVIDIKKS